LDWNDIGANTRVSVLFPKAKAALSASQESLVDVFGVVTLDEN
jgi:hypothetical protein